VLGGGARHKYTVDRFTEVAETNIIQELIETYFDVREAHGMVSAPLWIGEGATTYDQPLDAEGLAMLFNYVNILGHNGLHGVQLFARQSIYDFVVKQGGHYEPTAPYCICHTGVRFCGRS
jgi:hypothetical protein